MIFPTPFGPVKAKAYKVSSNHYEYTLEWNDEEWDSIECDNGVKSQQPQNAEDALRYASITVKGFDTLEDIQEWFGIF